MTGRTLDVDRTRRDIRGTFRKWDIDPSEFEILWEEDEDYGRRGRRLPGAKVRYFRNKVWQVVSCHSFAIRSENLRQCFLLLDRLRIAEQHGVQYQGLTSTREVAVVDNDRSKKEDLMSAYDFLGVGPDDPIDLVKDVYRRKSMYYHPDKGGDAGKFKRLTGAYELICNTRGVHL